MSITAIAPEGKNLGPDEGYLPALVQNGVSGDFIQAGSIAQTQYMLTGDNRATHTAPGIPRCSEKLLDKNRPYFLI